MTLTQERLKALIAYDPVLGTFRWRQSKGAAKGGALAGSVAERYLTIRIDGALYQAHRLAWLYVTGEWPPYGVDHKDLDGFNNRFGNLRPATQSQNNCNTALRRDNSSGAKGVSFHAGAQKWRARISLAGREKHLGLFKTKKAAIKARRIAAETHYGDFARHA